MTGRTQSSGGMLGAHRRRRASSMYSGGDLGTLRIDPPTARLRLASSTTEGAPILESTSAGAPRLDSGRGGDVRVD